MPDISRIWRPGRPRSRAVHAAVVSLIATAAMAGTSFSVAAAAVSRPAHSAAATAGELHGVWCTSAADCVAVGDHFSQAHGIGEALIERWNGSTWSVVPSPAPVHFPNSGAELDGVTCVSATDCLAVGWHLFSHSELRELPFAVRWNGSKWLAEQPARPGGVSRSTFEAVSCPGAACVAVGNDVTAGTVVSLAEGWSGTKWTVEPTPSPSGAKYTFLQGVACTSGRNCWAAGEWGSPTGPRTLIEHWNGSAWSITP